MADELDGEHFIGQDSNAFGDGTTDAATKFLSVRQENRLDGNARYLQERGSQVTYSFRAPHGTDTGKVRPYASEDVTYLLFVPWEVYPGLDVVRARIWAEVIHGSAGVTGEVGARLVLHDSKGSPHKGTVAGLTETGAEEEYTLTLDLSDKALERNFGFLGIQISSARLALGSTVDDVDDAKFTNISDWGISYSDGQTLDGELDEKSALSTKDVSGDVSPSNTTDILHKSPVTANSEHATGTRSTDLGVDEVTTVELSRVKPLAISIEERFDDTQDSADYDPKSARSMQGQEPVLGQDVSGHGSNLDAVHVRPRCKAIGPQGQDQGVDWPTDYRRKWSWLNATDEPPGDAELDRQQFRLSYDGSDVRCLAYIVGFFQATPDDLSDKNELWDLETPSKTEYRSRFAKADLQLDVSLQQMQSTSASSWSDATSVGSDSAISRDLPLTSLHPAPFPLASQAYWARHPKGSTSEASEYRFTYHEGQLWPEDLTLFGPAPVTIDVPVDSSVNREDPIRCDLDFSSLTNIDTDNTGFSDLDHTYTYHLLCLGTSWWEVPSV